MRQEPGLGNVLLGVTRCHLVSVLKQDGTLLHRAKKYLARPLSHKRVNRNKASSSVQFRFSKLTRIIHQKVFLNFFCGDQINIIECRAFTSIYKEEPSQKKLADFRTEPG